MEGEKFFQFLRVEPKPLLPSTACKVSRFRKVVVERGVKRPTEAVVDNKSGMQAPRVLEEKVNERRDPRSVQIRLGARRDRRFRW